MIVGIAICAIDCLLFLCWLGFIPYLIVHDAHHPAESYLTDHTLASLHFLVTAALFLVLYEYKAIKMLKGRLAASFHTEYVMAWLVSILVALGTDTLSVSYFFIHPNYTDVAWYGEIVIALWGLVTTVLALIWSIWLWVVSNHIRDKQLRKGGEALRNKAS